MKIPSKSSSNLIKDKISSLSANQKSMVKDNKSLVSLDLNKITSYKSNKSYSIRFVNYVEPYIIKGKAYTLFYTEVDHNLLIGNKVFISGGNYDSDALIQRNKFDKQSNGYEVLYVEKTKIVLDIEYNQDQVWDVDPTDSYIKIYVASTQDEFNYFSQTISNRNISIISGSFSVPTSSHRFSYQKSTTTGFGILGTASNNTILYLNGTFSTNGYGIYGFSQSGTTYSTYGNSFLAFDGIINGYYVDITQDMIYGSYSKYISSGDYVNNGSIVNTPIVNNGKLLVMNDFFTKNGISFKKDFVYQFNKILNKWEVDRTHTPSFITEQNFRNGIFKKGEHNQGLFGSIGQEIIYNGGGVKFNLGTVLNTKWINGGIGKGNGNSISYYTDIDPSGNPYIRSNASNNAGFGYNYVYNSEIQRSTIQNGNFIGSIVGSQSSENIVLSKIKSQSPTYSVSITGGNFIDSDLIFSKVSNSTLFNSSISRSEIQKSKSVNSDFEKSYFQNSKYTSDKIIKIEKYQEDKVFWYDESQIKLFKTHKFYLSEKNFKKIQEFQNFYFDGISLNGGSNQDLFNFFDDKFQIESYCYSFDGSINDKFDKYQKKIIVQLSTKEDNRRIYSGTQSNFTTLKTNDQYDLPSIDLIYSDPKIGFLGQKHQFFECNELITSGLFFGIPSVSLYVNSPTQSFTQSSFSGPATIQQVIDWLNSINLNGKWSYDFGQTYIQFDSTIPIYKLRIIYYETQFLTPTLLDSIAISLNDPIIDVSNAYIVDSDFKSGIFKDSEWLTGNYINYNKDNSFRTDNNGMYFTSSVSNTSDPTLTLSIRDKYRPYLFDQQDVVFINSLYYDTSLNGGTNLFKLPDSYQVLGYTSSTPERSIQLVDILGTYSTFNNVPQFTNQRYLLTKNAENKYNYIHPVKFENSKIRSGIFRRAYFQGCEISNEEIKADKNAKSNLNYRKLAISDVIFNNNSNTIKTGLFRHSHVTGGSGLWNNGTLMNSIWNGDSFTYSISATGSVSNLSNMSFGGGVIRESSWVSGTFENGIFTKSKSNLSGTSSSYSNSEKVHYSKDHETRYSWRNGIFKNGIFELSNWENGIFQKGEFYNSNFFDGKALGGVFGKKNIPYFLTKVLSGSFSNVIVDNSEFRSQDPLGNTSTIKSIDWYSGIFNSGLFGVQIDSFSYSQTGLGYGLKSNWYDGEFNGGQFADSAIWKNGKFNGGKFNSYYGYPEIQTASYSTMDKSLFAWQGGEFNGGEFGNAQIGTNSTWFNGEFNGGIFSGRYWNNGVFSKGHFLGSGTLSTTLENVPKFVSGFGENYYGLWNDGFVTEVKDEFITNKKFYTKLERESTKKSKKSETELKNIVWRSGTFSHNDAVFSNSIWLDGEFKKGIFKNSSFNPYLNYIVNGNFNSLDGWYFNFSDQIGTGGMINPIANNLGWEGTSSTTIAYQHSGLEIGESYTMTLKISSVQDTEVRFGDWIDPINGNFNATNDWILLGEGGSTFSIVTGAPGHILFSGNSISGCHAVIPGILKIGKTYDLTFYIFNGTSTNFEFGSSAFTSNGVITPNGNVSYSSAVSSNGKHTISFVANYPDFTLRVSSNGGGASLNGLILTSNPIVTATNTTIPQLYNMTFTASNTSVGIEFSSIGVSSLSGATWPDSTATATILEVVKGSSGFNLSDSCIWRNGRLEDSEFFISKWENGKWKYGNSYGMIWQNGIADYMNAFNIYWGGGTWRNGNWNGAPFTAENISLSQSTINPGFASDILTNVSKYRQLISEDGYQDIFINNAFTASNVNGGEMLEDPDLNNGFISASFSILPSYPNHQWTWHSSYFTWVNSGGIWSPGSSKGSNPCIVAYQPNSLPANQFQVSPPLYAMVGNTPDIFTSSTSQYNVTIDYLCYFGPTNSNPSFIPKVVFEVGVGYDSTNVVSPNNSINGGKKYTITELISPISPVSSIPVSYRGQSSIKTLNYTFNPLSVGTASDSRRLYIKKMVTSSKPTVLHILKISINQQEIGYHETYNNATYSIFGATPSYSDILTLPSMEFIGGNSNIGNQISVQFGNGIFESGTFSSVWENGVWNEGLRYDKKVVYFDDMKFFTGTTKPMSYQGSVANKGSNEVAFSQNTTTNTTYTEGIISYKPTSWIISITKTIGNIILNDGSEYDQTNSPLTDHFKIGDKVAIGNIVGIDINNNRRLIKDYLVVISVSDSEMSLEVNITFPIRRIERDSKNHLIFVSKNIWMNGAFLNGLFKGVWNNGLFKGYPFITKMVDSSWIDGIFDGGKFKGSQLSMIDASNTTSTYNSGLVQNFMFKDNDTSIIPYKHSYNSWVDVNYYTSSTVTIGKNNISYDEGDLFGGQVPEPIQIGEYSQTNLYSFPTDDVLSSISKLRNNFDTKIMDYNLGVKVKEFGNYLSDITAFENYYNSNSTEGSTNLITDGFTWSQNPAFATFKTFTDGPATASLHSNSDIENESKFEVFFSIAPATGGIVGPGELVASTIIKIDNELSKLLEKQRYCYISFDFHNYHEYGRFGDPSNYAAGFFNLNNDAGTNNIANSNYLDIFGRNDNVKEYFYNRRGLNMIIGDLLSIVESSVIISNLKLVETDMIPFIQLATASKINQSIASPWQAISPFINYTDANFSLIDNIVLSETIFTTVTTNTTISSGGAIVGGQSIGSSKGTIGGSKGSTTDGSNGANGNVERSSD